MHLIIINKLRLVKENFQINITGSPAKVVLYWYAFWTIAAIFTPFILWQVKFPTIIFSFVIIIFLSIISYYLTGEFFKNVGVREIPLIIDKNNKLIIILSRRLTLLYFFTVAAFTLWQIPSIIANIDNLILARLNGFDNPILNNLYLDALINYFRNFFSVTSFLIGAVDYYTSGRKKYFLLSLFAATLESVISLGRLPLMKFFLCYLLVGYIFHGKKYIFLSIKRFLIPILFIMAIVPLIRNNEFYFSNPIYVIGIGLKELYTYGVVPFYMLENLIQDKSSFLHLPHSYGLSSLGPIDTLLVAFRRILGYEAYAVSGKNGGYLRDFIQIATDKDGVPILANAFGTFFTTLYRDGGYIFVFLISFIYGIYFRYLKYKAHKSFIYFIQIIFIMLLTILSMFVSQIETFSIVMIILNPWILRLIAMKNN